ncbi:1-aminocyclopropane-1-carboxylate deaminase/D-cysteine desulfhydrase [Pedobacter aquatilis]|uniref:1-aminocyclopropane-1-carboxylate deaminase/D-cysteine desulfhydrase n=1 Tax=Pedobacter aquatilis TaxID=351343 RepID=UPI00292F1D57|nr:pyridoxal-phosphate dependent enzyme [Pedobacter aquatilis]
MFKKIYSPVEKIELLPFNNLFVKRDDLIDPYISGNKWRKLKYILIKAKAENKNHLITFGGAFSNHLVATAAATARCGLKSTAFVRGEEVENEMLLLCRLFGMKLIFVSRALYKNKAALFQEYFKNDDNAFFIDEGGASEEAVIGCAEVIDELTENYDHLFCAAGTGTTAAGLLQGIKKSKLATKLHVIPVLKNGLFIKDEILKYTDDCNNLVLHTNYHFGGYAKTNQELIHFIKTFTANTGLLIDPVYTAKMFYAISDLQQQGVIGHNESILALHTGGLLGIFGMKDKF